MPTAGTSIHPGDRILLRDRVWRVSRAQEIRDGLAVDLEALDGIRPPRLTVAVPPDRPQILPSATLVLEASALEAYAPWAYAQQALSLCRVRDRMECSGALYGRVALESYQLMPALRVLSKPRPSLLIADDVGLGKTIEAGLILLELEARGLARRSLIVVPPGLLLQWEEELRERFGLRFTLIESAAGLSRAQGLLPAGMSPWDALPRILTSVDYLKKDTVRARALRKRWDLVIVDEAHSMSLSGTPANPYPTQRARLGVALRSNSRGLILLTATPHNGYRHAFRSLVELVEPSAASLHGKPEDLARRIRSAMIRRMKAQIVRRGEDGKLRPVFLARKVLGIQVKLDPKERELLRKVGSYCSKTLRGAEGSEDVDLVSFAMQIVKKRAISSRLALETTIEHRLKALRGNGEDPPTASELREFAADVPQDEARAEKTAALILCSAIPREEKRRKAEISALNGIKRLQRSLPAKDPKIEALVQEIRSVLASEPGEKFIVFTEYRDTLEAIAQVLEKDKAFSGRFVRMTGGMTPKARQAVQDRFETEEIRVLLATDAASEGLNLQRRCRRVIHFELPWNPNRLEQRNGRVDRYGQARHPEIRYLFYPDSPEDDVMNRLVEKIERMQKDEVSTPDMLGILAGSGELGHRLALLDPEATSSGADETALVHFFEDRTKDFVRDVKPLLATASEGKPEDLSGLNIESRSLLGDDLSLEALALGVLGPGSMRPTKLAGVFRIEVPARFQGPGVDPCYPRATFRRSIAVQETSEKLVYITPLHPMFRAIAGEARKKLLHVWPDERALPPRRLAARRIPKAEQISGVFTFLGQILGASEVLEERIVTVRVTPALKVLDEDALRWLDSSIKSGEVPYATLERLFAGAFVKMQSEAAKSAQAVLERVAGASRSRLSDLAEALTKDIDRDLADRLAEIDDEEKIAKGLVHSGGQALLFADEEKKAGGFDARRAAARSQAEARRKEIADFALVEPPAPVRSLGALLLVPENEK